MLLQFKKINKRVLVAFAIITFFVSGLFFQPITPASAQEEESTEVSSVPTPVDVQSDKGTNGPSTAVTTYNGNDLEKGIFELTSFLGSAVFFIGGQILNVSAGVFTIHMADTSDFFGITNAIGSLWSVVRDLFNLLFIFGLIFIGFKIILGLDDSGAKRMLGSIVIAALLINFSLYVAQLAVDFSNVLSYQISNLLSDSKQEEMFGSSYPKISQEFVNLSGISEMTTSQEGMDALSASDLFFGGIAGVAKAFVLGLLFLVFYMILGFVFAAGGIMLFTRFIALIVLMIFSPLMFIGMVFPFFKNLGSDWKKYFVGQLLVGPAYLFMIYISLRTLDGMNRLGGNLGLVEFIFSLMIVAAMAMASLIVAKKSGAFGASQAINIGKGIGKQMRGFVGNATVGVVGRNTFGRLGDAYNRRLEKEGVSDKSLRRNMASSLAGRKYGGSYSRVDARSSEEKAGQKKARYNQIQGINTAIKGTDQIAKERAITGANNEQIIELLGQHKSGSTEYESIVKHMSSGQFDAVMKAKPEELNDTDKVNIANTKNLSTQKVLQEAALKKAKEAENYAGPKDLTSADAEQKNELLKTGIRDASEAQLKILGAEQIVSHAGNLKQSQFDDIIKSKDYTETEKENIKGAREKQQKDAFDKNPEAFIQPLKGKDIAKLPKGILTDNKAIPHLNSDAISSIVDEQTLTPKERVVVAQNIVNGVMSVDRAGNTTMLKGNQGAIDFLRNNPKGRHFAAGADIGKSGN